MARGQTRAPSQNAYKGSVGITQTETVHVTSARGDLLAVTVHTTVDAVNDPELVERLYSGTLNQLRVEAADPIRVDVPVVYHDPAAEVFVLVLAEAQRHRELDERIRLLERLRTDHVAVPAYVKDFAVVFGAEGLRKYLEAKAHQLLAARESTKELDRKRTELASREAELQRALQQLAQSQSELERSRSEHEHQAAELERSKAELDRMRAEARARVIAAVQTPTEATTVSPAPTPPKRVEVEVVTESHPLVEPEPVVHKNGTNGVHHATHALALADIEVDDEPTGNSQLPSGADPLTTETTALSLDGTNRWGDAATSTFAVDTGVVHLGLVAGDQIARGLTNALDVRVLLHRVATYPLVTLLVGPPAAFRAPSPTQLVVIPFDIGAEGDRAVLAALAQRFELVVDVLAHGQVTRRVRLTAPLADNVAYILRAADDHLRGITADGETEPSFPKARDLVLGAGYDLLGVEHAEASEFRDDKLTLLSTGQAVRRALAIVRRFARPSREDYLVCARGYPLSRWRDLRGQVLERAVAWGLWMGPELAQVAVSGGLARSRRDLILKLEDGFEQLRRSPQINDLDSDAADDNLKEIAEEARAQGVELRQRKSSGAIKSEEHSVVSGSIEGAPPSAPRVSTTDELVALLDDKHQRVAAASALCDRGDTRAAGAVVNAVKKMSRAEAVRILGKSVKFGPSAAPALMEGLQSSKAFLRHGCALALALLRTEEGTHAVIEQLIAEPTEIWREIARAIGQIGPTALMPLASHVGRLGDQMTPALQERVAWAMAHVAVRGGKAALEQMGAGHSVVAPIARQALSLHGNAARDEVRVVPGHPSKDVTVNRAFSRRFFEALEVDRPEMAQQALQDLDASGPAEVLDESDLIVDGDEEAELDESDLIQT